MSQVQVTRTTCDWCGTVGEVIGDDAEALPEKWTWQTDNERSEDLCAECSEKRGAAIDAVRKQVKDELPF